MLVLKDCAKYVSYGMALRTVCTFISFYLVKHYASNWNIYLVLPILLTILDFVDNVFIKSAQNSKNVSIMEGTNCTRKYKVSRIYHTSDKIIDTLSYILCYIYFYKELNDPILEFFILHRLVGVICFISTFNKYYLVGFFDFVKEYMLYKYFFKNNYVYLPFFVIIKIIFEYVLHLLIL